MDITGTNARVTKVMESEPRRISEIHIEVEIVDRNLSHAQKDALEKAALTCPVALSLNETIKQCVSFKYRV